MEANAKFFVRKNMTTRSGKTVTPIFGILCGRHPLLEGEVFHVVRMELDGESVRLELLFSDVIMSDEIVYKNNGNGKMFTRHQKAGSGEGEPVTIILITTEADMPAFEDEAIMRFCSTSPYVLGLSGSGCLRRKKWINIAA